MSPDKVTRGARGPLVYLKFVFVGGMTSVGYFALLHAFLSVLHWNYRVGVSVAYVLAITGHFIASRYFTFSAREERAHRQLPRYLTLAGVNYLITIGIVYVGVELLATKVVWCVITAWVVTTGIGFLVSSGWVFPPVKSVNE